MERFTGNDQLGYTSTDRMDGEEHRPTTVPSTTPLQETFHAHAHDLQHIDTWVEQLLRISSQPVPPEESTQFLVASLKRYNVCFQELVRQSSVHSKQLARLLAKTWAGSFSLMTHLMRDHQKKEIHYGHERDNIEKRIGKSRDTLARTQVELDRVTAAGSMLRSRLQATTADLEMVRATVRSLEDENGRLRRVIGQYIEGRDTHAVLGMLHAREGGAAEDLNGEVQSQLDDKNSERGSADAEPSTEVVDVSEASLMKTTRATHSARLKEEPFTTQELAQLGLAQDRELHEVDDRLDNLLCSAVSEADKQTVFVNHLARVVESVTFPMLPAVECAIPQLQLSGPARCDHATQTEVANEHVEEEKEEGGQPIGPDSVRHLDVFADEALSRAGQNSSSSPRARPAVGADNEATASNMRHSKGGGSGHRGRPPIPPPDPLKEEKEHVPQLLRLRMQSFPRSRRIPSLPSVLQFVLRAYDAVLDDRIARRADCLPPRRLGTVLYDVLLARYGTPHTTDVHCSQLVLALDHYTDLHYRIRLFADLIGSTNKHELPTMTLRDETFVLDLIEALITESVPSIRGHHQQSMAPASDKSSRAGGGAGGVSDPHSVGGNSMAKMSAGSRRHRGAANHEEDHGQEDASLVSGATNVSHGSRANTYGVREESSAITNHGNGRSSMSSRSSNNGESLNVLIPVQHAAETCQALLAGVLPDQGKVLRRKIMALPTTMTLVGRNGGSSGANTPAGASALPCVDFDSCVDLAVRSWSGITSCCRRHLEELFEAHCSVFAVLDEVVFANDEGAVDSDCTLIELPRRFGSSNPLRAFRNFARAGQTQRDAPSVFQAADDSDDEDSTTGLAPMRVLSWQEWVKQWQFAIRDLSPEECRELMAAHDDEEESDWPSEDDSEDDANDSGNNNRGRAHSSSSGGNSNSNSNSNSDAAGADQKRHRRHNKSSRRLPHRIYMATYAQVRGKSQANISTITASNVEPVVQLLTRADFLRAVQQLLPNCTHEQAEGIFAKAKEIMSRQTTSELRDMWRLHADEKTGDTYFENTVTGKTQWSRPYRLSSFRSDELNMEGWITAALELELFRHSPFRPLLDLAPKELWPRSKIYYRQMQEGTLAVLWEKQLDEEADMRTQEALSGFSGNTGAGVSTTGMFEEGKSGSEVGATDKMREAKRNNNSVDGSSSDNDDEDEDDHDPATGRLGNRRSGMRNRRRNAAKRTRKRRG